MTPSNTACISACKQILHWRETVGGSEDMGRGEDGASTVVSANTANSTTSYVQHQLKIGEGLDVHNVAAKLTISNSQRLVNS